MSRIAVKIIIALVSFIFLQVGSLYAEVPYSFKVKNTEFIGSVEKEKGDKKTISFVGIPFAKPPVGDLRWKAPRKIINSKNNITSKDDNFCVQRPSSLGGADGDGPFVGTEDCLYLDLSLIHI